MGVRPTCGGDVLPGPTSVVDGCGDRRGGSHGGDVPYTEEESSRDSRDVVYCPLGTIRLQTPHLLTLFITLPPLKVRDPSHYPTI